MKYKYTLGDFDDEIKFRCFLGEFFQKKVVMFFFLMCPFVQTLAQDSVFEDENTVVDTIVSEIPIDSDANRFLEPDTLDIDKRIGALRYRNDLFFDQAKAIDSSLTNMQYFAPYERIPNRFRTVGNLGLHHYSTFFNPNLDLRFNWGYENLKQYDLQQRYFNSPYPITVAQYVLGLYNEQYVHALHTQNLNKYINVLFEIQAVTSEGLYAKQFVRNQDMLIAFDFDQKKKYRSNLTFKSNRKVIEQNGGIDGIDFAWTMNPFNKDIVVPINLANANRVNKNVVLSLKQSFDLGFEKSRQDSMIILLSDTIINPMDTVIALSDTIFTQNDTTIVMVNDSVTIMDTVVQIIETDSFFIVQDFYSSLRLFHHFEYNKDQRYYLDESPPTDFYPNFYTDPFYTNDSLRSSRLTNEVGVLFLGSDFTKKDTSDTKFRAQISAVHEYVRLKSITTRSDGLGFTDYRRQQNAFIKLRLFNVNRDFMYDIGLSKGFYGINASGYNAYVKASYDTKFGKIGVLFQSNKKTPDYFFRAIKTNNYFWQTNNFSDVLTQKWQAYFSTKNERLKIRGGQYLVDNYVYLDEQQDRQVLDQLLLINQLEIQSSFDKAPWFGQGTLTLQNTNVENFPIPNLMVNGSFWYEGSIFSNSFNYQIGLMVDYNTDYFAPQFAPAIEQFYWSTGEKQTYYPLVDLFLTARVRTVRLFLRSKHITQGIFRKAGIEYVRNYPMPDRGVSFGVTWWFYD